MPPKLGAPAGSGSPPSQGQHKAAAARSSGAMMVRLLQAPAVVALSAVLAASAVAAPAQEEGAAGGGGASTLCNVPPTLSGEDKQAEKIKHPRSASAARCTSKCVSTCILGGAGSPGVDGPFNIRRPLVVFKEDFRSRQYCLLECSDICNLIKDGEDGQ
ncbi:uncharacterized protein LOC102701144 [Oryza brachyantha]|uniref:uncharacterized protein LOC102701144 n=1 Tax=Oryza brachyantha TaxID=4533 RepID=UPI001ADAB52F|nr:uncharacterized protein LOC102701144 [Oryza brachyantha]